MRFFLAKELPTKPFIYFQGVANSEQELVALNLSGHPLVLEDVNIPDFQFGVSPLKIVNGQLELRTTAEMSSFEEEFNIRNKILALDSKKRELQDRTFEYRGLEFPMTDAADLYYRAIAHVLPRVVNVVATTQVHQMNDSDIPAFLEAYYNEVFNQMTP